MKANKIIAIYHRMRSEPLWRLLAADNSPIIIGLLQTYLYEDQKSLPASTFQDRLSRDLEELRANGEDLPQIAQTYIANWLANGYLERRFPANTKEEVYELSTAATHVIRFMSGLEQPHRAATESRLTLVIDALIRLAEDTDADKFRRLDRLYAEQERLDKAIDAINKNQMRVLPVETALERAREIITLTDGLTGDFRRVRDQFENLNRDLRVRLMDNEESRAPILNSLFAGIDLIEESEAGRTFKAFWRLLIDPEQSAIVEEALVNIMSREFALQLSVRERKFLRDLTGVLLEQGGQVHEVLQTFARSLRHFVQSREYLEQRRLNQLLKEAQHAALILKDKVKTAETLQYTLELTSSRVRSISQWVLHDPSLQALPIPMQKGESLTVDLEKISELISQSEIDFRTLKMNIRAVLQLQSQASIADILQQFPAAQGLGSIVGLLALGSRHGVKANLTEPVAWKTDQEETRSARIPKIFFLRERINELS